MNVWQYAVQKTGHDFEPISKWSSDAQAAIAQLKVRGDVDLLAWDAATDASDIYPQYTLADLVTRVDHTAYARLLERLASVVDQAKLPVLSQLQRQWYLASYVAAFSHQSLLNTAAALLSLTVLQLKTPPLVLATAAQSQLRGLADQARCWLLAAQVSDLQLIATDKPLATLLTHLIEQTPDLDECCVTGKAVGWELANDAYWLSQVESPTFKLEQLQTPVAYRLIRAAYLERSLG